MGTIRKPHCLAADNAICIECLSRPFVAVRRSEEKGNPWAKDVECMKCFPSDARLGAGCGGLGLNKNQILVSNIVSVSGTMLMRVRIPSPLSCASPRNTYDESRWKKHKRSKLLPLLSPASNYLSGP